MNKKLDSKRFGGWTYRCNGFKQHGLKPKQFLKMAMEKGATRQAAKDALNKMIDAECWYSDCGKYKVVKQEMKYVEGDPNNLVHDPQLNGMVWLSIRIDNGFEHLCDWRDFQEIKNDLCGTDRQAVEIYPPDNMLHDTDNVFHLWVFPKGMGLAVGWTKRDVSDHESPSQRKLGN